MSVTRVKQSAVLPIHTESFWSTLAKLDFKWWNIVEKSDFVSGGANQVNSVIKLTFKDSATWTVRVTGISGERKSIEFELIESEPSPSCTSSFHELTLSEVTFSNETFFSWTADYSSDASKDTIQDSKFKRIEAFKHLVAHSVHGTFGQPNTAAAALVAHLAASGKHPHLNHVETHVQHGASDQRSAAHAAADQPHHLNHVNTHVQHEASDQRAAAQAAAAHAKP